MAESAELAPGLKGLTADWSSDQQAFKNVSWGKAMMWIFLVSDTFIFGCFSLNFFNKQRKTSVLEGKISELEFLSYFRTSFLL